MNYNFFKTYNVIFIFVILYISLVTGFFLDENLNLGAKPDWYSTDLPVINDLSIDLKNTLLNYDNYNHRHSPIYLIFLSFFKNIGMTFDTIRLIHLNLSLLLIYFFYKCLSFKFSNIEKNILLIFSFSIFLSPTFRSLSIWPSSRIIGLIFFTISILEFLKFLKFKKKKYMWKNTFFLILSSYISPNFSIFIIFFVYHYFKKNTFKDMLVLFSFCLISTIPVFYYMFILDVNFMMVGTPGLAVNEHISLSFNFSDKILIISSIILFQLIPFLMKKSFFHELIENLTKKDLLIISTVFFLTLYFFNYQINFTGGGIFFQISNIFFGNNLLFYIISFFSLLLLYFFSKKKFENFIIFFVLIVSNIQNTIYHKYYDPLLIILFFSIFYPPESLKLFDKKKNIIFIYSFYVLYIFSRIAKNTFF